MTQPTLPERLTSGWEAEFDQKFSDYFKGISVVQYNDAGVNIGFFQDIEVVKAFIKKHTLHTIAQTVEEVEVAIKKLEKESEKFVLFQKIHYQSSLTDTQHALRGIIK